MGEVLGHVTPPVGRHRGGGLLWVGFLAATGSGLVGVRPPPGRGFDFTQETFPKVVHGPGKTAGQKTKTVGGRCFDRPMSSQPNDPGNRVHPVADFGPRLCSRLEFLATTPTWSMTPQETRQALRDIARGQAELEALRLRVLLEADRSGATDEAGAQDAAAWVAVETRQVRREARSDLRLAKQLDQHPLLETAMTSGRVNPAQARVIVTALDRLPTSGDFAVSMEQRAAAEEHLVGLAERHDAQALATLGRRILEVIAPELAEQFEGRALEAQEARALRKVSLTISEDGEGICHGRFRIPSLHGGMLTKFLQAFTNPARSQDAAESGIDPDLPTEVRNGMAFCDLLEAIPARWMPKSGGCGATVVVTMTLEQLLAKLDAPSVCTLDTGGVISASEARRLSCSAGIIPMVLGGKSLPLDIGRTRRFHKPHQRLAMGARDGGCSTEDCDKPASMTVAHHEIPWSEGGPTSVEGGRLLCPHHHRRIHDRRFEHTRHPNGKISFHRRT
jgi:hypothetical protein